MSCKKEYNVEFSVENNSERKLQINYQNQNNFSIDSNLIGRGQELIFLVKMGDGENAENYIEGLAEIPVDFIEIKDLEENKVSCEPIKMDCWSKNFFGEKEEQGTVSLRVRESSFE